MNRITLRILLVLLLAVGIFLTAASCKKDTAEEVFAAETTETTVPADPQPPTTASTETEPQEERFLLTFVGDCTFGTNPSNYNADSGFVKIVGEDYRYPFRNVIAYFENDEFSIINLEGPLCDGGYPVQKKHTFRGPTDFVNIITENSIEAVSLANNHTLDYGQSGYESTLATLNSAGIPYVERDSSTVVTTKNGLTIGLYGAVYYRLDVETITAELRALDEQGPDLVIFVPHWGNEGSFVPTYQQEELGRAAIDAGADIVFGSHPHVLQPVEYYNGGVIYYSLGNFSFGGNGDPNDYDTALLQQEVIRDRDGAVRLGELTMVPATVSSVSQWNNFQPTPYEEGTDSYDRVMAKLTGTWHQAGIKIG